METQLIFSNPETGLLNIIPGVHTTRGTFRASISLTLDRADRPEDVSEVRMAFGRRAGGGGEASQVLSFDDLHELGLLCLALSAVQRKQVERG